MGIYSLSQKPVKVVELEKYNGEKVRLVGTVQVIRRLDESRYLAKLCDSSGCVNLITYANLPNCSLVNVRGIVTKTQKGILVKVYNRNSISCIGD